MIGPYQNLFHQGNAWSHELYERTGGLKKIEHDTAVFAPQLRTVNQPHYSLLMPEEVFYIFRGLNYISSEPQQHLGEIELKPHWQVDYPRFVQEHLASGIAVEIDRSLPELTFKNRQKLSRYGYLGARRYYVFEDRKLAYISNAKVACTSIKTAMMQPYNIHEQVHNAWPYVYRGALPDEHQDFFTFSFVRNPFDRLVSGYRNKIYSSEKEAYGDISTNITFSEFVTEVVKRPDCLINNHFQSQNCKLYKDGELLVDYLGRFENLAKDWLSIAERFNFTPQLPHKMKSSGKRGAYRDYRDYYTERLVHLVYNRFQTDVEMFGYQKSYEELLAFVREKK
ncbi:MAG: hypothetical protein DHS20C20_31010 [Ardenticatenaceae bacterium]|nr:MAG: hypothetical protein DHS20C20_31010 [Ardenticatenaceae bacterium]